MEPVCKIRSIKDPYYTALVRSCVVQQEDGEHPAGGGAAGPGPGPSTADDHRADGGPGAEDQQLPEQTHPQRAGALLPAPLLQTDRGRGHQVEKLRKP